MFSLSTKVIELWPSRPQHIPVHQIKVGQRIACGTNYGLRGLVADKFGLDQISLELEEPETSGKAKAVKQLFISLREFADVIVLPKKNKAPDLKSEQAQHPLNIQTSPYIVKLRVRSSELQLETELPADFAPWLTDHRVTIQALSKKCALGFFRSLTADTRFLAGNYTALTRQKVLQGIQKIFQDHERHEMRIYKKSTEKVMIEIKYKSSKHLLDVVVFSYCTNDSFIFCLPYSGEIDGTEIKEDRPVR